MKLSSTKKATPKPTKASVKSAPVKTKEPDPVKPKPTDPVKPADPSKTKKTKEPKETKEKKDRVSKNPHFDAAHKMIMGGASPGDVHKKLGVRRGFARRLLRNELKKLGADYTNQSRIQDGKAVLVDKAPSKSPKKSKETPPKIDLANVPKTIPKRHEVREVEGGHWGLFDTVKGKELPGQRTPNGKRKFIDERARGADLLVYSGIAAVDGLIKHSLATPVEIELAKAVRAVAFENEPKSKAPKASTKDSAKKT